MAEARLRRIDALRNAIIEFDSLSGVESGFADAARGARRQLEVALYDQAAYESQNRSKQE